VSLYHEAPYTLVLDDQIPDGAPLSAGMTELDADQVIDLDQIYSEDLLTLELSAEPFPALNAHAVVSYENHVLGEDFEIRLDWGDGVDEYASGLDEGHPYSYPGSYRVTAVIESLGEPSLSREGVVTVPSEEPEEPEVPVP
jgi:hypothetical protein